MPDCAIRVTARLYFCDDTAATEIYTLSLHDALPISAPASTGGSAITKYTVTCASSNGGVAKTVTRNGGSTSPLAVGGARSEEHTSELQSQFHLVCRLLLEKTTTTAVPTELYGRWRLA